MILIFQSTSITTGKLNDAQNNNLNMYRKEMEGVLYKTWKKKMWKTTFCQIHKK